MNRSEQINELAKALAEAQAEMGSAAKSSKNPHFNSKYAGLAEVIEVAKALARHGIAVFQPPATEDNGSLVSVETMLVHTSGQWASEVLKIRPMKPDAQGVGSAITYARRYGLSSFVGIPADEDDDGNAESARGKSNGNGAPAPELSAEDRAKTVADWKKEIEAAPERAALDKVGSRIAAAREHGCITTEQCEKELNLPYANKIASFKPAAKKAEARQ